MTSYVLNVRADQIDVEKQAIRLRRPSLSMALAAAGQEVLLYAPRDRGLSNYFATAILGDPIPDLAYKAFYWLPLQGLRNLDRPITRKELVALGIKEPPFQTYSRPIREVRQEVIDGLSALGQLPAGFVEAGAHFEDQAGEISGQDIRYVSRGAAFNYRQVRFAMLDAYGPQCVFTRRTFPSLDGSRYGLDVGHIQPRSAGGPTIIQNVLPMSKDINFHWDEGLISLTNGGDLMIAEEAGADTRQLLANFRKIKLPTDVQLWPDAKYMEFHRTEIFKKGPQWLRR